MPDLLTSARAAARCTRFGSGRARFVVRVAAVLVILLQTFPGEADAQRRRQGGSRWGEAGEVYWGVSISARFGRTQGIGLYPMVGYKITPRWSVGGRIGYEFWWRDHFAQTVTSHALSGSLFSRYRLIPQIYAHVEGGAGNFDRFLLTGEADRVTYPFLFVGGGFSHRTGRRTWLLIEILYEVIQDAYSPYDGGGPVISIGMGVGF